MLPSSLSKIDIDRNEWRRRQCGALTGRKQAPPPGRAAFTCHLSSQHVISYGCSALLYRRFVLRNQDNRLRHELWRAEQKDGQS